MIDNRLIHKSKLIDLIPLTFDNRSNVRTFTYTIFRFLVDIDNSIIIKTYWSTI